MDVSHCFEWQLLLSPGKEIQKNHNSISEGLIVLKTIGEKKMKLKNNRYYRIS